jgi:hypothetical protein
MSEATLIPLSFFKCVNHFQFGLVDLLNDHLCYPVATVHGVCFFPKIDESNPYFASVIRIDRSWSIDDTDPMLKGETASRPYLNLKARR